MVDIERGEFDWSRMTSLQTGRFGELIAMTAFLRHAFDVYSTEVDERGVDFIARRPDGPFYEVQVKTLRALEYMFMRKSVFPLRDSMLACFVLLLDGVAPRLFLIPSLAWRQPDALLVERNYEGLKSQPEWGVNLSKRNLSMLDRFDFDQAVESLG